MKRKMMPPVLSGVLCFLMLLCLLPGVSAEETVANRVEVSTVDEFLEAIAPDTEIVLAPGEYNLTEATGYGRIGGKYYHWESTYDGCELVITDAANLTINGQDAAQVTISTEPRYSNVLRFDYAVNLKIENITLGHTKEQGACIGGVLVVESGSNVEVVNTRLYGCGVRGIDLRNCQNVRVDCTDVYECSQGCVYVEGSSNVLFENGKFYNCVLYGGVFEIYSSYDVAVINSEVYGNYSDFGYCSLVNSDCPGIYLGGLDVHDNQFNWVFQGNGKPVTVESCRFDYVNNAWAENVMPVDVDGKELTPGDLHFMKMRVVSWEPAGMPGVPKVEAGEDGKIHVTNVDEFLAAIGPDTTIYLEPGEYNLTQATGYSALGGAYYHWESTYDGYELVIRGANNLTIEGASPEEVSIVTEPRYANVLRFVNMDNLCLKNIKVGHTLEPGACSGGVLMLEYQNDATIENCKLFGCGTIGIEGMSCSGINVKNTEIYQCSSGGAWFYRCSNVSLDGCDIHDIDGQALYADYFCYNVLVDGEPFLEESN